VTWQTYPHSTIFEQLRLSSAAAACKASVNHGDGAKDKVVVVVVEEEDEDDDDGGGGGGDDDDDDDETTTTTTTTMMMMLMMAQVLDLEWVLNKMLLVLTTSDQTLIFWAL
jgi:hypothetical protein